MKILFETIHYADWTRIVPLIAFAIAFTVFLGCIARALTLSRKESNHMAHLPFSSEESLPASHHEPTFTTTQDSHHGQETD